MSFYPLFATTIFLSSFLLFFVQPLLGKHILPWYGGSSAVWVTALLFFMVALALGYVYALMVGRLRPRTQALIHSFFVLGSGVLLYTHVQQWPSGITPAVDDITRSVSAPVQAVFSTLFTIIGIPFVLLAATSSLLQLWYARISGKEPFALYSISNIGSLLGLLSYPLIFEPFLSTTTQGSLWSAGMFLYCALMFLCATVFVRSAQGVSHVSEVLKAPAWRKYVTWIAVSAVPVLAMLTGTVFMSTAIAPVPFLWVGPLALYLVSFIYTFRSGGKIPVVFNESIVVLTAVLSLVLVVLIPIHISITILITHIALFALYHWCHEYLYSTRPAAQQLGHFYVALSLGGIVGSLLVKLLAAYVFSVPIELVLILSISAGSILYRWYRNTSFRLLILESRPSRAFVVYVFIFICFLSSFYIQERYANTITRERNFFGYKAVAEESVSATTTVRSLQHGLTNHGTVLVVEGEQQIAPTSYYSDTSGVGRAFLALREKKPEGLSVAIMGLGSGGLAAHCKENDAFTFIEIDSEVRDLAYEYFSYLEKCPQHTIILDDARLALTKKASEAASYDLIVMDAYADDMAPIHLLTTEAFAVYRKLLNDDGILAVHISSRYLDLLPVMKALAQENTLAVRHWYDEKPTAPFAFASHWVLFAKNESVFTETSLTNLNHIGADIPSVLWTDTHSALLPVVRWR